MAVIVHSYTHAALGLSFAEKKVSLLVKKKVMSMETYNSKLA